MALTANGEAEQIPAQMATGNLMSLLGVQPQMGRALTDADDQPNSHAVALLGYGLWQRKYNGSTAALGESIRLNNQSYTIIGVLPKSYELLQQKPEVLIAMGPWAQGLPD